MKKKNIINIFIKAFNNFLETKSVEDWRNSLNIINKKIQNLKNKNGLIYIIFNLEIAKYLYPKNEEEFNKSKTILIEILHLIKNIQYKENYNNDLIINENYLKVIIDDYIAKLRIFMEIYDMIYS